MDARMAASLDRYLTSEPPDDGFQLWSELITNHIPDDLWDAGFGDWYETYDGEANKLLQDLFYKDNTGNTNTPEVAAKVMIDAYNKIPKGCL